MKTRYRIIARRTIEAGRHVRRRHIGQESLQPCLDDPMELSSELIDLATGTLAEPRKRGS